MNHKMSERPQETRLDFGSDEILAQSNAKQAAPIERSVAIGGVLLIVRKAKKPANAAIRGAGAMRNPPQSGYTRPSSEMGNERDQKQYQKDEKQDLRDAGECNSDTSEADSARDERDDQKHQSPIQHCSVSFYYSIFTRLRSLPSHGGKKCEDSQFIEILYGTTSGSSLVKHPKQPQ
jgi:hypothetical protein